MDLIEQLGGYEKAKQKLNMFYMLRTETMVDEHGNLTDRSQLESQLLQYRRQHNIFEVGDKVKHDMSASHEIFTIMQYEGFNFLLDDGDWVWIDDLSHATDEEIKAKRRLEN